MIDGRIDGWGFVQYDRPSLVMILQSRAEDMIRLASMLLEKLELAIKLRGMKYL